VSIAAGEVALNAGRWIALTPTGGLQQNQGLRCLLPHMAL
jgi:hypothetical protein